MSQASKTTREQLRKRRHARVRSLVSGTPERPRLSVSRSLRGMYAQLIDDTTGKTVVSVDTKSNKVTGDVGEREGKIASGYLLGKAVAEKAKEMNITTAVFDRGGHKYHGRVQAVADGARDGGLVF
jgi:large subunit ribosomal protein L18